MLYFIVCMFQRSTCAYVDCSWFCFVTLRTCGTFTFGLLIEQAVCRKASCGVGLVAVRNSWTVTARLPWLAYANGTALWLHRYWLHKKTRFGCTNTSLYKLLSSTREVNLHGMYKFSPYFVKGHSSSSLVSMLRPARLSKYSIAGMYRKVLSPAKLPSWPLGPTHSLFCWVLAALSPQVKRTGPEADHSPPCLRFEVWSHTSILLHGLLKNNFAEFLSHSKALIFQYSFANGLKQFWMVVYSVVDPPAGNAAECASDAISWWHYLQCRHGSRDTRTYGWLA
jgi:hypothetical protein